MRLEIRCDKLCRLYHVLQLRRGGGWHRVSKRLADVLERYAGIRVSVAPRE